MTDEGPWVVQHTRLFRDTGEQDVTCRRGAEWIAVMLPPIEYLFQPGDIIELRLDSPEKVAEFRVNATGPWISAAMPRRPDE